MRRIVECVENLTLILLYARRFWLFYSLSASGAGAKTLDREASSFTL